MDPTVLGPLDWFVVPQNGQGIALALASSCCISVATLLYKSAGLATVLIGVLMAGLLTVILIPLAALYFHLFWPWWPVIGLGLGVASLRIMRGLDAFADKLEKRLPSAGADRVANLVRGGIVRGVVLDEAPEGEAPHG